MNTIPPYVLGVDLGGTRIKAVAVTEQGEVLARQACDIQDRVEPDGPPFWAGQVREILGQIRHEMMAVETGVGLAAPGLASRDNRTIAFMPGRLAGLEGFDWTSFLDRKPLVPVLNDAQAALLGESWIGAAKGCRDAFLLTLGTGVGGAVLSGGRILRGVIGRAGHLGHISLDPWGKPDVTGTPGSLEDAIGECTLRERGRDRYSSTLEVVEAFRNGDAEAARIWLKSIHALAAGIASLINVLDPEVVLLGGGIAEAGEALFTPLGQELDRFEWRPGGHRVDIRAAQLGEWAGAIGAARNAFSIS